MAAAPAAAALRAAFFEATRFLDSAAGRAFAAGWVLVRVAAALRPALAAFLEDVAFFPAAARLAGAFAAFLGLFFAGASSPAWLGSIRYASSSRSSC